MKKILLSAAAFAVFMSATPANALFSGSKTEMTTTFGSDYATKLANADVYANNIKNLLSQLYTAVQNENVLSGSDLSILKEAITERTIGTSGYLMKYIKKVAELGNNLKNAKSTSTLQTRVNEIEKDSRKSNSENLLRGISDKLKTNPSLYPQTIWIMQQIATYAYNGAVELISVANSSLNKGTSVYSYIVRLENEYEAIYKAIPLLNEGENVFGEATQQTTAGVNLTPITTASSSVVNPSISTLNTGSTINYVSPQLTLQPTQVVNPSTTVNTISPEVIVNPDPEVTTSPEVTANSNPVVTTSTKKKNKKKVKIASILG